MKIRLSLFATFSFAVCAAASAPPYFTSFEASEGAVPGEAVAGWSQSPLATVVTARAAQGNQSVVLAATGERALIAREFDRSNQRDFFIDLYIRPAAAAEPAAGSFLEVGVAGIGFKRTSQGLQVLAFDGDGAEAGRWVVLHTTKEADEWLRVTFHHDYAQRLWNLYLDGKLVRAGLGFFGPAEPRGILGVFGGLTEPTYLDAVFVGPQPPAGIEIIGQSSESTGGDASTGKAGSDSPVSGRQAPAVGNLLSQTPNRGNGPLLTIEEKRERKIKVKLEVWSVLE